MTKEEFIALYEKCAAGNCTAEELHLLEAYQDEFELARRVWSADMGDPEEVKAAIMSQLRAKMQPEPKVWQLNRVRWIAAASILLMLSAGLWFYRQSNPVTSITEKRYVNNGPILPGGNKAILTLANGDQVDLDNAGKGLVSKQGNAAVTKSADGELIYQTAGNTINTVTSYNTITTPRGGQYQLILADGTQVWLNAASSLRYPTSFTGTERTVELKGEAYFEVAKDKGKPFKVLVNDMNVKVLGTHFDVMAYDDEEAIQTTLLEGSVQLTQGPAQTFLIPGQQGVLKKGAGVFQVRTVNLNDVVSWKNGVFVFDNENIQTIMRKVARWYNVDVEYKGDQTMQNFGGSVSRFDNIAYVLKTLELTGTIHFKIDGRRIIVMP